MLLKFRGKVFGRNTVSRRQSPQSGFKLIQTNSNQFKVIQTKSNQKNLSAPLIAPNLPLPAIINLRSSIINPLTLFSGLRPRLLADTMRIVGYIINFTHGA
jgi:hypothetical protein